MLLAGTEDFPSGARSAAVGHASASFTDLWSVHHNQAGLGFVRNLSAGVSYENRFLMKEISVRGAAVAIPVKGGTFGLGMNSFGYSLYSENKYSLSFAKAFGEKFSGGIAMDYVHTRIGDGYGSRGALVAEAGIIARPLKNFSIGAHVYNPNRARVAAYADERLPTVLRLGADYKFSANLLVAVEAMQDIAQKTIFKAGLEYRAVKSFYLRAGVSTQPTFTSFGFGVYLRKFKMDVAASYHQVLGISPQLSLSYAFGKQDDESEAQ